MISLLWQFEWEFFFPSQHFFSWSKWNTKKRHSVYYWNSGLCYSCKSTAYCKKKITLFFCNNVCQKFMLFLWHICVILVQHDLIRDSFGVCIVNANFNWTSLTNWKPCCCTLSYCEISLVVLLDSAIQNSDITGCETVYFLGPKLWFSLTM